MIIRKCIAVALSALLAQACFAQSGVPGIGMGVPSTAPLGFTPAQVFNVTDYGAKCNGTTNDNTAINAALTAAAQSTAYQNNNSVAITGPSGAGQNGCVINSLNFTQFNKGTAANPRPRVEFYGMNLLCTGTGNICLDGLNGQVIHLHDISIRGDGAPNTPEIGIQIGISSQNTSSAFHVFERVNLNNEFALADLYNMGSETFTCIACYFTNAHTTNGPIGTLGAITGGSGCSAGTNLVSLTGGSGSGVIASVTASGGAVTAVNVLATGTYEGRDYAPGDSLAIPAPGCSGASILVSTVTPYAVVMDGQNHWRVASSFTTVTTPVETWESFTVNRFFGGSLRQNGAGKAPLWAGRTEGLSFYQTYFYGGTATPSYCAVLFDNGITKTNIAPGNSGMIIEAGGCEGGSSGSFFLTGANNTPTLTGFTYLINLEGATSTRPVFAEDTNITGVTINNLNLKINWFVTTTGIIFKTPTLYTITGNAFAPTTTNWNTPTTFSGQLCTTTSCVNH